MPTDSEIKERARIRSAEWRKRNPDRVKESAIKGYKNLSPAQIEARRAYNRKLYQATRSIILAKQLARRESDPERIRAIQRKAYKKAPHKAVSNCARRQAAKIQATPLWADRLAIAGIYREARWLSEATGVRWDVDHIYPLRSKIVCGLHVETNLRPMVSDLNKRKSNKVDYANG